jgi:hypothetical protein
MAHRCKRVTLLPLLILVFCLPESVFAQITTANPLDEAKARVEGVLSQAGVPFTEDQDRQLALVMEESRRASEQLFGEVMDFRQGPVRGAQRDRALAGIQFMNEAFETKLNDVLTPEQAAVWERFRTEEIRAQGGLPALRLILSEAGLPLDAEQERRAQQIYQTAAERLQAAQGEGAGATTDGIETETLSEVADLLSVAQQDALIAAFTELQDKAADQSTAGAVSGEASQPTRK